MILRFDQSDRLKVSFGRYHTPINYWNTAFHHGQWLQTTIARPEMIQFGGRFLPVHFVGALVEGSVPAGGWNLNYKAGVGNGRATVISRGGDAGDVNGDRAWLANAFSKPDRLFGLEFGGSFYGDTVTLAAGEFDEQIVSGLRRVAEGGSRDHRGGRRDPARGGQRPRDLEPRVLRPGRLPAAAVQPAVEAVLPVRAHRRRRRRISCFRPCRGSTARRSACATTRRAFAALKGEYRTWTRGERRGPQPRRVLSGVFHVLMAHDRSMPDDRCRGFARRRRARRARRRCAPTAGAGGQAPSDIAVVVHPTWPSTI